MAKNSESSGRGIAKKILLTFLYLIPLVGLAVFGAIFFSKYQTLKQASPDKLAQTQVDDTISKVGKLYALPTDEKPDVVTVKDKAKLGDQPFFAKAQNGDVTLIYYKSKLAILYRPSNNQLVNVSTLSAAETPKISLIGTADGRESVGKLLLQNKVIFTDGGDNDSVVGITVVDLNGKNAEAVKKLAETIKGQVGRLPEGVTKPADADIAVLVGPPVTP